MHNVSQSLFFFARKPYMNTTNVLTQRMETRKQSKVAETTCQHLHTIEENNTVLSLQSYSLKTTLNTTQPASTTLHSLSVALHSLRTYCNIILPDITFPEKNIITFAA